MSLRYGKVSVKSYAPPPPPPPPGGGGQQREEAPDAIMVDPVSPAEVTGDVNNNSNSTIPRRGPRPSMANFGNVDEDPPIISSKEATWRDVLWTNRGIFCAVCSSFTFAVTAILVKLLKGYDPMDIALWRCQGVIIPATPIVIHRIYAEYKRRKALPEKVKKEEEVWWNWRTMAFLWGRSILAINALFMHFISLRYIPAGDSIVISSCTPIFAYLLGYFVLGEPYGWVPFFTSVLTLFGVMTIVRPPFLTGEESFDQDVLIGSALAMGCTILTSISFICLRNLRKVPFTVTALAYALWGVLENSIIVVMSGTFSLPRTQDDWIVAVILGGLAFLGQVVIVLALKIEQAGPVSLIRSFDVLFGFFFGSLIVQELPDVFSLVGAAIVLVNVFITGMRKWIISLPDGDPQKDTWWWLLK